MEGITIRVLAISDIHGCYDEFNQLLLDVCFDPDEDRLILLGDYVDRGLRSKEVVEQVMALQDCGVITLRGNHDQMMLDAILLDTEEVNSRWIRNGARHTIESYCGADFFEGEMERDKYNEGKAYIKKHYEHHLASSIHSGYIMRQTPTSLCMPGLIRLWRIGSSRCRMISYGFATSSIIIRPVFPKPLYSGIRRPSTCMHPRRFGSVRMETRLALMGHACTANS